jgi:hypothetical protein
VPAGEIRASKVLVFVLKEAHDQIRIYSLLEIIDIERDTVM